MISKISGKNLLTCALITLTKIANSASINSRKASSHVRITSNKTGNTVGKYETQFKPKELWKMNMIDRTTMCR